MENKVRKYLKPIIEDVTGMKAYYIQANVDATYPYITFELREITGDDINKHNYDLTVDVWDKNTPFNIITALDELDEVFKQYKDNTEDFVITVYHGTTREPVEDSDKSIYRYMRKYESIVFSKGE